MPGLAWTEVVTLAAGRQQPDGGLVSVGVVAVPVVGRALPVGCGDGATLAEASDVVLESVGDGAEVSVEVLSVGVGSRFALGFALCGGGAEVVDCAGSGVVQDGAGAGLDLPGPFSA